MWPRCQPERYHLPWDPAGPEKDNTVYLLEPGGKSWKRLGPPQPSPQNLYEMTTLAFDSKRDRLLLHGGGKRRDELWAFALKTGRWRNLAPAVTSPGGAAPPVCNREAVYLPAQDVLLTYGPDHGEGSGPALWTYRPTENVWRQVAITPPPGIDVRAAAGQNRGMVYDAARDLVLLVLGARDKGDTLVYALRYRDDR
jgi:hypothetical protein